ncbi:MAG: hypothetical protein GY838_13550 [bacterium]|nr:hypothetical protein [bacterium]
MEISAEQYKTRVRQHIFAMTRKSSFEYPGEIEPAIGMAYANQVEPEEAAERICRKWMSEEMR